LCSSPSARASCSDGGALAPRLAEGNERGRDIICLVVPLLRQLVGIDRDQVRPLLAQRAPEPHVIAVALDVAQMAGLPQRGETLAGNALPGRRHPRQLLRRHLRHQSCNVIRHGRELGKNLHQRAPSQ
jgi:hypothetical protein